MGLSVVVLAAGEGARMRSALPKVLHPLAGRPLLHHVLDAAQQLAADRLLVVYGHGGEAVRERFSDLPVHWVRQSRQLGTGHALGQALPDIPREDCVLVLYGDVPLIRIGTLQTLVAAASADDLALLTAHLEDPTGYGRILRDGAGKIAGIVEERDATELQRAIREVNTGFLAAPARRLGPWLDRVENKNAQGEFYLTDVVALALADGARVGTVAAPRVCEVTGVNDRVQLAALERQFQKEQAETLMRRGVTLLDPTRFDVRGTVEAGTDVVVDVDVILEGHVRLGDRARIGPHTLLRNVIVGADVEILSHCVVEGAVIEAGCRVGPYSRVRPETHLASGAHVGNFVELKQANVGALSKINHLSYVGDAAVGARVNIGAGTITCNYDGADKHNTVIGDDVFIGSDTQLVAPVTVGAGATIGAGSIITRDVPAGELTLSRAPQVTRRGWKRPVKAKREA
jgi:bifunctional UDP-N-acetylglucosamine pyrophosphorylase/glucosamine-1-phosphate N-acetyltransferase